MFKFKAIYFLTILFPTALLSTTQANEIPEQTIVARTVYFSTNTIAKMDTVESTFKTDCFLFYTTKEEANGFYLMPKTGIIYYSFDQDKIGTLRNRIKAIYSDYAERVKFPSTPIIELEKEALRTLNEHFDQLKRQGKYQNLVATLLNRDLQQLLFADNSGYVVQFKQTDNKILANASPISPKLQLSCGRIQKSKAW